MAGCARVQAHRGALGPVKAIPKHNHCASRCMCMRCVVFHREQEEPFNPADKRQGGSDDKKGDGSEVQHVALAQTTGACLHSSHTRPWSRQI